MKFVRLHDKTENRSIDINLSLVTEICIIPNDDTHIVWIDYGHGGGPRLELDATGLHTLEMGMGVK